MLWTVKYKPKRVAEVVGNEEAKAAFDKWIKSFESGKAQKKAAFIYGPPGVGKTAFVEAYAHEHGYDLIEMNASDWRTASIMDRVAGRASRQASLYSAKKIIVLDELDGISFTDKGALYAILKLIEKTQSPIVLIANDAWDPRFAQLRSNCLMIEFKKLRHWDIVKHLRRICQAEKIIVDDKILGLIAKRAEGDMRSAVNDLQAIAQGKKRITVNDASFLGYRDRERMVFDTVRAIFLTKDCRKAKMILMTSSVDPDMLFEWIYENIPYQITNPIDMANAMENLAKADFLIKRARLTQHWDLLSFAYDLMTCGIAVSMERTKFKWVGYKFPQRIKKLSATKEERELMLKIGMKIRSKCHVSATSAVKEYIPYLRVIFSNNTQMAASIARWLGLTEEMIEYLSGDKKRAREIASLALSS